jgi:pimeloyl-ACP methyl ester carboxylesterase
MSSPLATGWTRSSLRSTVHELHDWCSAAPAFPGSLRSDRHLNPVADTAPGSVRPLVRNRPVVLVHGYIGNTSTWRPLIRRLQNRGFDDLYTFGYASYGVDVPRLAARLTRQVRRDLGPDAAGIHLIGHSLGGLIVRYAVSELGLDAQVATVTTIATPNSGAPLAHLCRSTLGRDLRPRSDVLRRLSAQPLSAQVQWMAYHTDRDVLVPRRSAVLEGAGVANVALPGYGHLSILDAPALADDLAFRLRAADLAAGNSGQAA